MPDKTNLVDVELKIPLTEISQPVYSKVRVRVPQVLIEDEIILVEDPEGNPILTRLALEVELEKYVKNYSELGTKIANLRKVTSELLPDGLGVTDFVSVGITHATVIDQFLKSKSSEAKVIYLAVWDDVTKVDAPIIKEADTPTTDSDFPSTEIPTETEEEPNPDEGVTE